MASTKALIKCIAIVLLSTHSFAQVFNGTSVAFNDATYGANSDYTAFYRVDPSPDYALLRLQIGDEPSSEFHIGWSAYWDGSWNPTFKTDGSGNTFMKGNLGIGTSAAANNKVSILTTSSLDGINMSHNNSNWTKLFSPSLTSYAYNNITGAGDAGIIFGSPSGGNTADYGFVIAPHRTDASGLRVTQLGKVGIGINNPAATLHVSTLGSDTPFGAMNIEVGSFWNSQNALSSHFLKVSDLGSGSTAFIIKGTGNVGIGTANPNQKLTVKGMIYSEEVKVDLNVPGPDYVFEKNYQLPNLGEIQNYINTNRHLPGVPSAKNMEEDGLNLGDMNMILLKKVEEITLYLIQQNSKLTEVEKKASEQSKIISDLQNQVEKLKKSN
jgi:hypothetical protein